MYMFYYKTSMGTQLEDWSLKNLQQKTSMNSGLCQGNLYSCSSVFFAYILLF